MAPAATMYAKLSAEDDEDDAAGMHATVYDDASWWKTRVTHGWVAPILKAGADHQLSMDDMPRCPQMVRVAPLLARYDDIVETKWQGKGEQLPLLRVLVGMMGCSSYIPMFICVGGYHLASLMNPMLLRELLTFVGDPERPVWHGVLIATTMFTITCLSGVCMAASIGINNTIGFKQQSILSAAIYRKALRLSRQPKEQQTVGEMVNLMSNDVSTHAILNTA